VLSIKKHENNDKNVFVEKRRHFKDFHNMGDVDSEIEFLNTIL
jgi:hypothetical protein